MQKGSRWWAPLYEGLIAQKHIKQMGPAIWLYLYILKYANRNDGEMMYSHVEASEDLDTPRGTIRRWFYTLQENGYIEHKGQAQNRIKVLVTNWRPVEEFGSSLGRSTRSEKSAAKNAETASNGVPKFEQDSKGDTLRVLTGVLTRVFTDEHPLYIRINKHLKDLDIPFSDEKGAKLGPTIGPLNGLEDLFQVFHRWIESTNNPNAALREFFRMCYPDRDPPDYGRIGVEARRVGGHGRLADLLWQSVPRPPTGDVLSYVGAIGKAKQKRANGAKKRNNPNRTDADNSSQRYGGVGIRPSNG